MTAEHPLRGWWWHIDATCQRYDCRFIATSAKEDQVNGKGTEAIDVASIRYPSSEPAVAARRAKTPPIMPVIMRLNDYEIACGQP